MITLALTLPLAVLLSGCTNGNEEVASTLPTLLPVSELEGVSLDAIFAHGQERNDAPQVLVQTFPDYNWNQARAIGSVDDFGLWVTRQEESICLIVAYGAGKGQGFSSGQRCKSEDEFAASGIQQAVAIDENMMKVWVYPDSVDIEPGWQALNSFVAVPDGSQ